MNLSNATDETFMRRAIALATNGFPAPNPHVGCVIVRPDGEIVGEGWCAFAGAPHAEAMALAQAGSRAKGATAYVTLEPCNHHGRTPPCSQALVHAQIARVVVGTADPNPKAAHGAQTLRAADVAVEMGLLEADCIEAAAQFHFAQRHDRPFVTAKAAATLDGRIATRDGRSRWITGPEARQRAHAWRAECGAVLVGRGTVEADDPLLTARIEGAVNPVLRVVLDPQNRLDQRYRVFNEDAETWHITGEIDLPALLARIRAAGHTGLLIEGGGITIGRFMQAQLVDRIVLFQAPMVFGGGPAWCEGDQDVSLETPVWEITKVTCLDRDLELVIKKSTT